MEGLTYLKIRKAVEEAFPQTCDCDYTKLTPDRLLTIIHDSLKNAGLLENENLKKIGDLFYQIRKIQENVYQRKSAVVGVSESKTFDQNNYFLVSQVLQMKNKIMSYFIDDIHLYGRTEVKKDRITNYTPKFGANDEIEVLISREAILEYISKAFILTKEDIDGLYIDVIRQELKKDIFYHFGILDDDDVLSDLIDKCIDEAKISASTYTGKYNPEYGYEGVKVDNVIFSNQLEKKIPELVDEIERITKKAYERKLEQDQKEEENKPQGLIVDTVPLPRREGDHETFLALGSAMDWPDEQTTNEETKETKNEDTPESDLLAQAKEKLKKMEESAKKQAELIKTLEEMEKEINAAKNRLAEMEEKRKKIITELQNLQSTGEDKGRK